MCCPRFCARLRPSAVRVRIRSSPHPKVACGWKRVIPDLPGLGCLAFKSGHSPRPPTPRLSQQYRWWSEAPRDILVHEQFAAPRSPPAAARGIMPYVQISDDVRSLAGAGA